ncbi:hypothetical protein R6Q59_003489 [Mikania micrantha]
MGATSYLPRNKYGSNHTYPIRIWEQRHTYPVTSTGATILTQRSPVATAMIWVSTVTETGAGGKWVKVVVVSISDHQIHHSPKVVAVYPMVRFVHPWFASTVVEDLIRYSKPNLCIVHQGTVHWDAIY